MNVGLLAFDYLVWHYTRAFRDIVALWRNFSWFVVHFFSIPLNVRTFFAPWKRVHDTYTRTGFEDIAETFVFNLMSRILGMIMRAVFISAGIIALIALTCAFLILLIIWPLIPMSTLLFAGIGILILTT